MRVACLLPHLKKFGGVRRFIEIANEFSRRGHETLIYTLNDEGRQHWVLEKGVRLVVGINNVPEADMLFVGTPKENMHEWIFKSVGLLFIYVISSAETFLFYRTFENHKPLIVNNRRLLQRFPKAYVVEGGVNTSFWSPKKLKVAYQEKKGAFIKNQLGHLKHVELVPLANMSDKKLRNVLRNVDWCVVWEEHNGAWANTGAEAISMGVPVVSNGWNCEPFSHLVVKTNDLRSFFECPMKRFDWGKVVDQLIEVYYRESRNFNK